MYFTLSSCVVVVKVVISYDGCIHVRALKKFPTDKTGKNSTRPPSIIVLIDLKWDFPLVRHSIGNYYFGTKHPEDMIQLVKFV